MIGVATWMSPWPLLAGANTRADSDEGRVNSTRVQQRQTQRSPPQPRGGGEVSRDQRTSSLGNHSLGRPPVYQGGPQRALRDRRPRRLHRFAPHGAEGSLNHGKHLERQERQAAHDLAWKDVEEGCCVALRTDRRTAAEPHRRRLALGGTHRVGARPACRAPQQTRPSRAARRGTRGPYGRGSDRPLHRGTACQARHDGRVPADHRKPEGPPRRGDAQQQGHGGRCGRLAQVPRHGWPLDRHDREARHRGEGDLQPSASLETPRRESFRAPQGGLAGEPQPSDAHQPQRDSRSVPFRGAGLSIEAGRTPLERHQLGDRRDDRPLAQDRAPRREARPSRSCRSGSPAHLVDASGGLSRERRSGSSPPRVRGEPSHRIPSDPQ